MPTLVDSMPIDVQDVLVSEDHAVPITNVTMGRGAVHCLVADRGRRASLSRRRQPLEGLGDGEPAVVVAQGS